jgi:hypothetical protein
VTNADNIASQGRLSVNFAVTTTYDTTLSIGSVEDVMDSALVQNKASSLVFNGGNGSTAVAVAAGASAAGSVNYTAASSSSLLSDFTISILDNGIIRKATLLNLPVGPVTTDFAQCSNTLPCIWASPDGSVTITLLSVGGYAGNGRLTANFQVLGTRDMNVAVDSGHAAVGDDGTRFKGRTHSLAALTGYEKITTESIANIGVNGSVDFYRTDTIPASLVNLTLVIYEDNPSPRWNPRFVAVPVQ